MLTLESITYKNTLIDVKWNCKFCRQQLSTLNYSWKLITGKISECYFKMNQDNKCQTDTKHPFLQALYFVMSSLISIKQCTDRVADRHGKAESFRTTRADVRAASLSKQRPRMVFQLWPPCGPAPRRGRLESPSARTICWPLRRTGEIENKSINRNRDFEFDFILRYINSERETLAYLLRKIRR